MQKVNVSPQTAASILLPSSITTEDEAAEHVLFDGMHMALWNGHRFEAGKVGGVGRSSRKNYNIYGFGFVGSYERGMVAYFPVDDDMKKVDVDGAYEAYPNASNTAWLFKHTEEDTHHDYEDLLWSAVVSKFHPILSETLGKMVVAPNEVRRKTHRTAYESLLMFQSDVIEEVLEFARSKHVGYWHQNPHKSRFREPIRSAISSVSAEWLAGDATKITRHRTVRDMIRNVLRSLDLHTYRTRAELEAIAAAETAEKATEGEGE